MTGALDADILAALDDNGEITQEQLRRLIGWEAEQIGLTYDEAMAAATEGTLPKTVIGMDIDLLARMVGES